MLNWKELEQTCAACRKCRLCEHRTNPVFGVGNRSARLMLIGEGPGDRLLRLVEEEAVLGRFEGVAAADPADFMLIGGADTAFEG